MNQDKMYLVNKLFNDKTIRTVWNNEEEKYFISVVDIEGMFRIIESIQSKNAESIKQWLAHLGSERIDKIFDSSIAAEAKNLLY